MINLFRLFFRPRTLPDTPARPREQLFHILLRLSAVLALPVLIVQVRSVIQDTGEYSQAALYIGLYLLIVLDAFLERWVHPLAPRVWLAVLLTYGVAASAYLATGVRGDGRIWLLLGALMAALFLEWYHGLLALLLAAAVHLGLGWYTYRRILPLPPREYLVHSTLWNAWVNTGITLFGVILVIGTMLYLLRRYLENNLEQTRLLNEILERERDRLERQGRDLQRRILQVRTAGEISQTVSAITNPEELIQQVVDLVRERFDLYYVGLFLLDETGQYAVLRAGTGEAGRRMLAEGHRLAVGGTSMIGWCIANRKPRIALDVGEDAVRFANPYLPLTRSELALPLIARGEVLGAMTVQSEEPEAFDQDDLLVLQSIANAVAIALSNARLLQTTQEALRDLEEVHRQTLSGAWEEIPESGLEITLGEGNGHRDAEAEIAPHTLQVPLRLYGDTLGEIVIEGDHPWSEDERHLVEVAARQITQALENAALFQESRRRAWQESLIGRLSARVAETLDLDQMLQTAARELRAALQLDEVEIRLVTPEQEE